jgi:hypothetical protein
MLCADVVLFKLVRKLHNFDLIVLDLSGVSFPGYRLVVFSLWCSCFLIITYITCYLILLINRDIWRGVFAALAVVSAGYLNPVCVSSRYLLVSCFRVAYCRAILFLRTGKNLFCEYFL